MGRDARSVSFGMRHVSESEFMGGNPFHIFPRSGLLFAGKISHIFAIISSFCLLMWFWCRMCCRVIRYLFLLFSIVTRVSRRDGKAVYGCQVSDDGENYLRYHFHRRSEFANVSAAYRRDKSAHSTQTSSFNCELLRTCLLHLNPAAALLSLIKCTSTRPESLVSPLRNIFRSIWKFRFGCILNEQKRLIVLELCRKTILFASVLLLLKYGEFCGGGKKMKYNKIKPHVEKNRKWKWTDNKNWWFQCVW